MINKLTITQLIQIHKLYLIAFFNNGWITKIIDYILACKTGKLGYTIYYCETCGKKEITNNTCNNRHCPNCGSSARAKWTEKVSEKLLPVEHFHLVFTLPHQLNSLVYKNQEILLDLLMNTVTDTLMTFFENKCSKNKKGVKVRPSFLSVLHTWTQDLKLHYHVHVLAANGALVTDKSGDIWYSFNDKFLFPAKALSKVFKAKFLAGLKILIEQGQIKYLPKARKEKAISLLKLPKKWNVYVGAPYKGECISLKYFARYANRVAISDSRIILADENNVTFTCRKDKNEPDSNVQKTCTLSSKEFVERFFKHCLPKGFRKIRYQGFYAGAASKEKYTAACELIEKQGKKKIISNFINKFKHLCKKCSTPLVVCFTKRISVYKIHLYERVFHDTT